MNKKKKQILCARNVQAGRLLKYLLKQQDIEMRSIAWLRLRMVLSCCIDHIFSIIRSQSLPNWVKVTALHRCKIINRNFHVTGKLLSVSNLKLSWFFFWLHTKINFGQRREQSCLECIYRKELARLQSLKIVLLLLYIKN